MENIFQHYNQQREPSVHFTIGQARSKHDHSSLKCETCGVHLCIECFTLFHTLKEPASLKTCVKAHEMAQEQQQVMANATNGIKEV